MIYTEKTKKALQFMFEAHKDQVDKSGMPYVFHPYMVATFMDDEDSTIVALLHDVVEDTKYGFDDISNLGVSNEVLEALICLTHKKDEDYFDYIERVSTNLLATKVKLADLSHNSDLSRLNEITEKDLQRYQKYEKCIKILTEVYKRNSNVEKMQSTIGVYKN